MIYGMSVNRYNKSEWYFCDPEKRFAKSYPKAQKTERTFFQMCLEDYLQDREGECSLPRETDPWIFVKAESEEMIKRGEYEVIVTLHNGNPEALWDLYKWCSGACTCFQIRVDY